MKREILEYLPIEITNRDLYSWLKKLNFKDSFYYMKEAVEATQNCVCQLSPQAVYSALINLSMPLIFRNMGSTQQLGKP